MTLGISMLNNIFPLHTKTKNYHPIIPTCYTKCHDMNNLSFQKVIYVDEYYHVAN